MSDKAKKDKQDVVVTSAGAESIPPQKSASDTSNWDDRTFTTPSGRIVIETIESANDDTVIAE